MSNAPHHRQAGFTLIELMIVVAIIAILASLAIYAYSGYIQKSRRAAATAQLSEMALLAERWRAESPSYLNTDAATTLTTTLGNPASSESGAFYTFSLDPVPTATTFTLKATAKAGTSQAKDTGCTVLTLNQDGTKTPTACWSK